MKKICVVIIMFLSIGLFSATLFVLNSGSETLSKIDTQSGETDNAFAVLGSMPNRFVCSQDHIYVVNSGDNSVQKIAVETGNTVETIYLGTTVNPYDLVMAEGYLYVSGGLNNQVYKIDLASDTVVDQVSVGSNPAGMAIYEGKLYVGNTDYLGNYGNCSISIIDLFSFNVINTVPTGVNPQYLLEVNGYIHISCGGNWSTVMGSIQILDTVSSSIVHTIDMGGICGDMTLTSAGIVYVGDAMNSGVYAYDASSWEVIYTPISPFTPGASVLAANEDYLALLGGIWGQNFTVSIFNHAEEFVDDYTVALYGTDMGFLPEASSATESEIVVVPDICIYPNPFTDQVNFRIISSRAEIESVSIYDLRGRLVTKTRNNYWQGDNQKQNSLPAGVYFGRIKSTDGSIQTRRIMKLK